MVNEGGSAFLDPPDPLGETMGNSLVINCWKTFHTSDAPSISEMSVELRFPIASIMFDDLRVTSIFWWRKMLTDAN